MAGAGLVLLGGLSARLYALTVQRHEDLRLRAERRSRRVEVLESRRGQILDRAGRPFASDRPARVVVCDLPELDPALSFVTPMAYVLRTTRADSLVRLRQARERLRAEIERDPEAAEGTVVLCRFPVAEFERAKRLAGRIPHLRAEFDAEGPALVTGAGVLSRRDRVLLRVAELTRRSPAELRALVEERVEEVHALEERDERLHAWRERLVLLSGEEADFEVAARISERAFELPGVSVEARHLRRYPFGDVAPHLLGFLGKPSEEERARDLAAGRILDGPGDPLDLRAGSQAPLPEDLRLLRDLYGRAGLERAYDERLRGRPGAEVVVRDVRGNTRESVRSEAPRVGKDLSLTLDVEVQRAAEQALDEALAQHGTRDAGGAAALYDLRSGEILALASSPRYEVSRFRDRDYYEGLRADPRKPQLHRALMAYPPGSTWKILSCFAMTSPAGAPGITPPLEPGEEQPRALPEGWTTVCEGRLFRNQRSFTCEGAHGRVGMERAIERSCNIFFFRAADEIGLAPIARWGDAWGMGQRVSSGIPGEHKGLVPRPNYKEALFLRQADSVRAWLERLHGVEQAPAFDLAEFNRVRGRLQQAGFWYTRYAQDRVLRPGDVRNIIIGQGDVLATPLQVALIAGMVAAGGHSARPRLLLDAPREELSLPLDPGVLSRVQEGMRRVVTRGTARRTPLYGLDVAGKTGTAERAGKNPNVAWFMGYYPASAPEVAFAVVVDRTAGHGGDVCAPATRKLLEAYEAARGGKLR